MSDSNEKRVLIIEDETKLARFIELELKYEGYAVDAALDGREGMDMFAAGTYDLILLDLMLPGINGLEILRRVRKVSNLPVIMLTARGEVMDKVAGLDSGADDYITKPFAIEELLARMRAALRKVPSPAAKADKDVLRLQKLSMDIQRREAKWDGEPVELTKTEFDLLEYFLRNKNVVLSREQILNRVWGYDYIGETNIVDVYVRYIRMKLDDRFGVKIIRTIRGVGYCAEENE